MYYTKCLNKLSLKDLPSYIHTVNRWRMLSSQEERVLTERVYYHSDISAARTVILANLRFVVHISRSYLGYGFSQSDLIQEGNIGLMKAVRRFNPNINVRVISFAVHWIKSEIHEYILKNWRIVKVATTKIQRKLFFNLRKTKVRLGWFTGGEIKIVARDLGVKYQDIQDMESRMLIQDITLCTDVKKNNQHFKIKNFIPYLQDYKSNFSKQLERYNWDIHAANKLNHAILKLNERSRYIIYSRWLSKKNKITLYDIACKYKISAERVRQLEYCAVEIIKIDSD
ncbi:RNA polymerase sigma factor RpoH [Buchnera aphidicola]|uniref:RNA polymerase sigma factor n=1 Tax=Buchnera aphidicola (Sarucallis kahawaluokalani) TaxID=1241878 RepID=A0A4D6YIL9_9GAMM|nr:RNA polymerase sigma factor RpoH [Buchnera aphidicola]QCI25834.1 RNA polymerase sigma factor RpoH [Buchnera aphidicola (Sarucallis kahawaluokalani)]